MYILNDSKGLGFSFEVVSEGVLSTYVTHSRHLVPDESIVTNIWEIRAVLPPLRDYQARGKEV